LDRIINSSFDGIYITDGHGNTLRLNHAFERITVACSECLGRNMADLLKKANFRVPGLYWH
jgi:PAS domain S-box-containing protein